MRLLAVSIFALLLAGCSGGLSAIPSEFTRERADGKIPVKAELIRQQVRKEIDGMQEGEATVWRWEMIERDYHACRLSSARSSEAEEVFANCMASNGYVYMYRIDAEQFHNDIDFEVRKAKDTADKVVEEKAEQARRQKALNDALLVAVKSGNKEEEIRLIEKGADASIAEREHERKNAELHRQEEAEKIALQEKQNEKNMALINAVMHSNVEEVKRLLNAGASPHHNIKNISLEPTKLYFNTEEQRQTLIEKLRNINRKQFILQKAITVEDDAEKRVQLIRQHDEHVRTIINLKRQLRGSLASIDDNSTALMLATSLGNVEIVRALINAGANFRKDRERTALMIAASQGHVDIAKVLINAGSNVNQKDNDGQTALVFAVGEENADIAKILLECGANPRIKNKLGADAWNLARQNLSVLSVFEGYQRKFDSGWRPNSCKGKFNTL